YQQRGCALDRTLLPRRIHAALIALARIGHEAPAPAAATHGIGREIGDLEEDVRRFRAHRGALAAHDARGTDGPLAVGDEKHVLRRFDGAPIEQRDRLTLARVPNDDAAAEL